MQSNFARKDRIHKLAIRKAVREVFDLRQVEAQKVVEPALHGALRVGSHARVRQSMHSKNVRMCVSIFSIPKDAFTCIYVYMHVA